MIADVKRGFNENAYEVKTDTNTVWINRSYGCVARFSLAGIEFTVADLKKPYVNTGYRPNVKNWTYFKKLVLDWYGFTIDDIWCPLWITEEIK